jgi:hypothetical protein
VRGEQQDRDVGDVAQTFQHLPAVHPGQADVQDHQFGPLVEGVAQPGATVLRVRHLMTGPLQ